MFRALQEYFLQPNAEVLQRLYDQVNNIDFTREKKIMRETQNFAKYSPHPLYSFVNIKFDYDDTENEPLKVPLHFSADQLDEVIISLIFVFIYLFYLFFYPNSRYLFCSW